MITLNDGVFEDAALSDERLSQDEPRTVLELLRQPVTADKSARFKLRLECEGTSVSMYLDDELLTDLCNVLASALVDR